MQGVHPCAVAPPPLARRRAPGPLMCVLPMKRSTFLLDMGQVQGHGGGGRGEEASDESPQL